MTLCDEASAVVGSPYDFFYDYFSALASSWLVSTSSLPILQVQIVRGEGVGTD